jgi:hypothetical protein
LLQFFRIRPHRGNDEMAVLQNPTSAASSEVPILHGIFTNPPSVSYRLRLYLSLKVPYEADGGGQ